MKNMVDTQLIKMIVLRSAIDLNDAIFRRRLDQDHLSRENRWSRQNSKTLRCLTVQRCKSVFILAT